MELNSKKIYYMFHKKFGTDLFSSGNIEQVDFLLTQINLEYNIAYYKVERGLNKALIALPEPRTITGILFYMEIFLNIPELNFPNR